jgi:hypothetical protein
MNNYQSNQSHYNDPATSQGVTSVTNNGYGGVYNQRSQYRNQNQLNGGVNVGVNNGVNDGIDNGINNGAGEWFQAPTQHSVQQDGRNGGLQGGLQGGNVSTFDPNQFQGSMNSSAGSMGSRISPSGEEDYANEPPLLEELGINMSHIVIKTKAVLHPLAAHDPHLTDDTDLAGPLAFALALGLTLLLTGKIHFGYIYGFGLFGCVAMSFLVNLMSKSSIDSWRIFSILGYCLLPINMLAVVSIVLSLRGTAGLLLSLASITWSTAGSTRLIERTCDMRDKRWLVAYPIFCLYSCFVMLTVF